VDGAPTGISEIRAIWWRNMVRNMVTPYYFPIFEAPGRFSQSRLTAWSGEIKK